MFLCPLFAPVGTTAEHMPEEIYYYDTVYAVDDGPMPIDMTSVTIPYVERDLVSHWLAAQCPLYTYVPNVGGCASVAAANVIGYYDRFDENLIPDHKSGTPIGNTYLYNLEDNAVISVIDTLYDYIIGNGYGATEAQFINGITRYCNEKGKSISFSSCMSKGNFNYSTAKTYLDQNLPIVLFLEGYNVGDLYNGEGQDVISYYYSTANHIMIGFGYEEFTYSTTDGVEEYKYLYVSSGTDYVPCGLYNFNMNTKINDALAVNIY